MRSMNLSRFDLNLLVVFDAIARTGSVTSAANALSLSQPAISHALGRLRESIGDQLFVRGRSGLVMTERARAMADPVAALLAQAGEILSARSFEAAALSRRFSIAASDYSMLTIVPSLVAHLRRAAPNGTVDLRQVGQGMFDDLESGRLDLCFWGSQRPQPPFQSADLFTESFVGLTDARHPLAHIAKALTLDDYLSWPHVRASLPDTGKSPIDTALDQLGRTRTIGLTVSNFVAAVQCLRGSDLVMTIPRRLFVEMAPRGLKSFTLPFPAPSFTYRMVWHRRFDADPAHQWLRQQIIDASATAQGKTENKKGGSRRP